MSLHEVITGQWKQVGFNTDYDFNCLSVYFRQNVTKRDSILLLYMLYQQTVFQTVILVSCHCLVFSQMRHRQGYIEN